MVFVYIGFVVSCMICFCGVFVLFIFISIFCTKVRDEKGCDRSWMSVATFVTRVLIEILAINHIFPRRNTAPPPPCPLGILYKIALVPNRPSAHRRKTTGEGDFYTQKDRY